MDDTSDASAPLRTTQDRVSQVTSFTLVGVDARPVTVEVSVRNGYPRTAIVGLPDLSVRESRERAWSAPYGPSTF